MGDPDDVALFHGSLEQPAGRGGHQFSVSRDASSPSQLGEQVKDVHAWTLVRPGSWGGASSTGPDGAG
jgi:hypothetical protein